MSTTLLRDEREMKAFAERMAKEVVPGTVIGLVGDLGAGKTTFTRYFSAALGVKRPAKSPTFILMQEFRTGRAAAARGIATLTHADAYRTDDERELWSAGLGEAVEDPSAVIIVEWADKMPSLKALPSYVELEIGFGKGGARTVRRH